MIVLLVGKDLLPNLGSLTWIGLGSLGTLSTLAAALPAPLFGRLADKYRRGTMMFISLMLSVLGSFLIGLLGDSFVMMSFGLILMGLGIALYHPQGLSWVSTAFEDVNTQSFSPKYVRILSLHGIGGSLGASIGPLSVYFLLNTLGWRLIYLFWSFPLTVVAVGFWILIARHESPLPNVEIQETAIDNKNDLINEIRTVLLLVFAFITVMSITRGMINFILSPFLSEVKNIEIATAALFVGLSTLIGATGEFLGGVIGDKFGERTVLSIFACVQIGFLFLIFISEVRIILLILYLLLGINSAFFWPSSNSLVAKNSKRSGRGRAFGWLMLIAHFFGALGPSIDGILLAIDPNQYTMIFVGACIFSAAGFLILTLLGRIQNNKNKMITV